MQNVTFTFDFKGRRYLGILCFDMFDRTPKLGLEAQIAPKFKPKHHC